MTSVSSVGDRTGAVDQGPAAGDVGIGRLRRDRHDAADCRRAAVRSRRPARRRARARRRRRQRQRDACGRAPLRAASRPPTTCRRCSSADAAAPRRKGSTSHSKSPTPRRCPIPTASFDVVLSTFGVMFAPDHEQAAERAAARVPARRPHRPGLLDAAGLPGPALQGRWRKHVPPRARRPFAAAVGHRRAHPGPVCRRGVDRAHGSALRVPLSVGGALGRGVPRLLWTGPQGVRFARRRAAGGARGRSDRVAARGQSRRSGPSSSLPSTSRR